MKKKAAGKRAVPNGHGAKFRRKDFEAIDALITEPTIQAAAERVGLGERTVRRWLQNPDFRKRYEDERMHRLHAALQDLDEAAPRAIELLSSMFDDSFSERKDRIQAAKVLLDAALKKLQVYQVERRLRVLEQKMAAAGDGESLADTEWTPDPVTDESFPEAPHLVPVDGTSGPAPSNPNKAKATNAPPVSTGGGTTARRVAGMIRRQKS